MAGPESAFGSTKDSPLSRALLVADAVSADGNAFSPTHIELLRSSWIANEVKKREAEYTRVRPLRSFVCTWNVNGKIPAESIDGWLTAGLRGADALPDLYVVGLQELVDLTATNVALGALSDLSARRSAEWESLVLATLESAAAALPKGGRDGASAAGAGAGRAAAATGAAKPGGPSRGPVFTTVGSETMVGLHILVIAKTALLPHIGAVQAAQVATGVLGIMGNKGAVAVRFRVHDTTLCFLCAHLAAHRGAVAARNADFGAIMSRLSFPASVEAADVDLAVSAAAAGRPAGAVAALLRPAGAEAESGRNFREMSKLGVDHHDIIVFLGDLNYRLDESLTIDEAHRLAAAGAVSELLPYDQLTRERELCNAFHGFSEAPLVFPPTFKVVPGSDSYERRRDGKQRAPAWCDRVLWRCSRALPADAVRPLLYNSSAERTSDHKPVHALLELDARAVVSAKRDAVRAEVVSMADRIENEHVPRLKLSRTSVDVGTVTFGRPSVRQVTLSNVGKSAAPWRFVPKPGQTAPTPGWLAVSPAAGYLPPGSDAVVVLTVVAGVAEARDAAVGRSSLDDTLVIRVEAGSDHYLSVGGTLAPTAAGLSLLQLARTHCPVTHLVQTPDGPLPPEHWAAKRAAADVDRATGAAGRASPGSGVATSAPAASADGGAVPPADRHSDLPGGGPSGASAGRGASGPPTGPPASRPEPLERAGPPSPGAGGARPAGVQELPPALPVPKEVWILVDRIIRPDGGHGVHTPGVFTVSADEAELEICRECVDSARRIPDDAASPVAAGAMLLRLLGSLREPVIPESLFPGRDLVPASSVSVRRWTAAMLALLPALHYNVLVYVMSVARESIKPPGAEGGVAADPNELAHALAQCLFRQASPSFIPSTAASPASGDARSGDFSASHQPSGDLGRLSGAALARAHAVTLELLTAPSLRM